MRLNPSAKITYRNQMSSKLAYTVSSWGGSRPIITLEYDERNGYLLNATIKYNRREAKKTLILTAG